ncbi:translocation/assembly module TamB [Cellulophaga sp. L1A9]|uniref:translocation/assembly module TamB n=1 Tax=Cellulophaga sp. L1A9 TaxID=2686362 RepID=UPI00131A63BC|nr:translocation/assembly module TamB [Cellulophaga sp. L1A9]
MGKKQKGILKRILKVFAILLLLFISIILFIRSQWGQDIIVTKVVDYVSSKTNTKIGIDRLFVTFSGNIFLEGLYLEDTKGDTLLYSKALEANLPLSPIILGNGITLKSLEWEGVKANIIRKDSTEEFNFNFLIQAFASQDSVQTTDEIQPLAITIGAVSLSDFDIKYNDAFLGIESAIRLGKLQLDIDEFDLETLHFDVDNFVLKNTTINYNQTKLFPVTEETTDTPLPYLSVENFKLENVKTNYNSIPDKLIAKAVIGDFKLELQKADLSSNTIDVNYLSLNNSTIYLNQEEDQISTTNTEQITNKTTDFKWPEYLVRVNEIDFKKNNITYISGKQEPLAGTFNPSALAISNLGLKANDLFYENGKTKLSLEAFSFQEKSGFELKNLSFDAKLYDTSAVISKLELQTNRSAIFGAAALKFSSIQNLMDTPENASLNLTLPKLTLDLRDAFIFQPELATNEYFKKLAVKPFTGNVTASGTLKAIDIPSLKLNWGENTQLIAQGKLYDGMQPDVLSFDFNTIQAISSRKDILTFVSESELGISVPKTIKLNAVASGSPDEIKGYIALKIPEGAAKITGNYSAKDQIAFEGKLKVDNLRLDKLLKNEQLGAISMTMNLSGNGNSINSLNANLETDFTQLELKDYDFSNLKLDGKIVNGNGDINLNFKDDNLNLQANTKVNLDTLTSAVKLNLNIIGADLYALGITNENIKIATKINSEFEGTIANFNLNTTINETIAVFNDEPYRMDDLLVKTQIDSLNTNVVVTSNFLNGSLKANSSIDKVNSALQEQITSYFSDSLAVNAKLNPIVLNMDLKLSPTPILTDVFFKDIEKLDTISMKANFNAATKKLYASLLVPSAVYSGSSIDSLNILVQGDEKDLNFTAGFSELSSDPIFIKKTLFEGELKNSAMQLDFTSYDENQKLLHIGSEVSLSKDVTTLKILPSELIFNKKQWTIPEDNSIKFGENVLEFNNVKLTKDAQELSITNTKKGTQKEHIGIAFNDFKLQTFLSLLNPDEALASGLVNGSLIIEDPFGATGIIADFKINQLKALQSPLGNLVLKANSTGNAQYNFDMALKDGGIDLDLTGDYTAAKTGAKLNLDVDLNKLELKVIEDFSDGAFTNTSGTISGNVKVNGTTTSPIYAGEFSFNKTEFKVAQLNAIFKIDNEKLKINNAGFYLNNFAIQDNNGNSFAVNGAIKTSELTNPTFDLQLKADAFQVMNSTKEDNELFYGKATMNADVTVKGDLNLPIVSGVFKVDKGTAITYIVPESQLDIEERDGVVIFVNQENPNAILTRKDEEEPSSILRGYKVNTIIEIDKDAVFNVIIDEKTGDNLQISGEANLNFGMNATGAMSLSGRYELKDGHYETILYNVVKRKFTIKPGSTITWTGSPTDANLDITAIYTVDASASPLMASLTSSEDSSVSSKYQQVLSFLVYLNVDGEILAPEISFELDMPEEDQSSLSGAVYEQVQQLNEQESELNKQVFSLLTLNRFFPSSGSDGSSGGTATIARNNVSKVLSDQLNTFSDKLLGKSGFELGFDFDSYTDYQGDSPEDRTQLNINAQKKLFNDRLIVSAGSTVDVEGSAQTDEEETPIIGNVSLEYLLSEDGRYRLKGFRKNEYENVIDGQLIITGVALIFNREFNSFSELFNPIKKEDKDKKDRKEKAKIEN